MAEIYLDTKDYIFNLTAKTITFSATFPNILITDITHIKAREGNNTYLLFKNGLTGYGGTLTGKVLTLTGNLSMLTVNSILAIEVNSVLITSPNIVDEDNKLFYENTTVYTNKYKGLKEVFTTDEFNLSEDGLYKIEINVEITNEDDKSVEIYNYLDNDSSQLLLKIKGDIKEEMEYHHESNFIFKQLTKGTHSITVYLETTENNKEAYMKNYQLLITKV